MKENLKRNLNKTYLVLSADENEYEESYELEMLIKNAPETILPLYVMRMDGNIELSYDVSSRQTLREFMLRGNVSGDMVRELFGKIAALGEDMKNYLLDIGSVLIDPEHIYRKGDSFCFCYCPWEKNDSAQMVHKLIEELLGKLDYGDAEGIGLAYHLYQASGSGDFDIREILREHTGVKKVNTQIGEEPEMIHSSGEKTECVQSLWSVPEKEEEPETKEKKPGIIGWLLKFFQKKEEAEAEEKPVEYPDAWEEISKIRIPGEEENFCFGDEAASYGISKKETSETEEGENDTVLLKSNASTTLLTGMPGGGWKLRPLLSGYEEFYVTGESFLVGKNDEIVDGCIKRETISRIHSRLYVKEDRLYIADANSTNGTYVNGKVLQPGMDTEIFAGDRVMFADVGYECYNSF